MTTINLLVADDNRDFCECLSRFLSRDPLIGSLAAVHDGLEALRAVEQHRPQVLVLDNCMPYLDGISLIRRLTPLPDYRPILFLMSAWDPSPIMASYREVFDRVDYFLRKPLDFLSLTEYIKDAVRQRTDQQENEQNRQRGRIELLLKNLGASDRTAGFQILTEALLLLYQDNDRLRGMSKLLYPQLADRIASSPVAAERLLRYEVERIFTHAPADRLEEVFPKTEAHKGKLTNKQFLTALAQKLGYL